MTPEQKQKIHESMLQLLIANGYPNLQKDQIINLLPALWKKLEAEGLLTDLIARGFDYEMFVNSALHARARQDAMDDIFSHFRNNKP